MILKFSTGKDVGGLLTYIAAGADQAAPLFSNLASTTPRALAREVAALRSLRPNLGKAVGHLILSHDPSQRVLTNAEWRKALDIALAEHGAENVPFAAWLHTDKEHVHLHVFLLRIDATGNVISDSNSFRKNERASRAIEQCLGLDGPRPRAPEDRHPRASSANAERGRRRFERLAASLAPPGHPTKIADRVIDPSCIFSAIEEVKTADLDALKKCLGKRGIEAKFVRVPGVAEPTGWLLRQSGSAGTWVKGSDVDRALSLKKVRERMGEKWRKRQNLSMSEPRIDDAPVQRLRRSGENFMAVLVGLSIMVAIPLVAGLINLIARVLACRFQAPTEGLGRVDFDANGTPHFIDPVDLLACASVDQRVNLDVARVEMSQVIDQATEAIRQNDTSLLPTMEESEVMEARAQVIKELGEIECDDDEDDQTQCE